MFKIGRCYVYHKRGVCGFCPYSVNGHEIARLILSAFNDMELDITKLRAQCYDGASNMSGKLNGVQAIIRQHHG